MVASASFGGNPSLPSADSAIETSCASVRPHEAPGGHGDRAWHARLHAFLTTEHHLVGASLLRIGLGGVLVVQLLRHWWERDFLWGPNGVYPLWLFERDLATARAPSFFAVQSDAAFQVLYLLTIAVALLYLIGWQTRWIGIWLYALTWSLLYRTPMLMTGGEKLLLSMLPYLVLLLDTSAYLSADSGWRRVGQPRRPSARPFVALLHNAGLACVFGQLAIMYGFSGFAKLLGEPWRDGTAVYYVLRAPEFTLPGWSPPIYQGALSGVLVPLLTYLTLAFELSFPLLIWSRRTRWLAVLQAVVFHAFIGIFLGLVLFAAQALVFQLVLVDDARYRSMGALIGRVWRAARRGRPRVRAARGTGS